MDIDVKLSFVPVCSEGTTEDLEAFLDRVMEELDNLGRDDVDYTASLAKRWVVFSAFDVEPDEETWSEFWSALRTALHAAGAATPGWPSHSDHQNLWAVEKAPA